MAHHTLEAPDTAHVMSVVLLLFVVLIVLLTIIIFTAPCLRSIQERMEPGLEDTSTIIWPDSSVALVAVLAKDLAWSRPGSDAAKLAIEKALSRHRSPKPGRTKFHGTASWSVFRFSDEVAYASVEVLDPRPSSRLVDSAE